MNKIVIIGGGGHAKVVASLLKKHQKWTPIGYLDIVSRGPLLGLPYLGTDADLTDLMVKHEFQFAAIGIGQISSTQARRRIVHKIKNTGIKTPPIVSPFAIVNEEVTIGRGTVVMDGAILQSGVTIGAFSIINTAASVDHDCQVGANVHLAPGVHISGNVEIGDGVLIGIGARIIEGLKITGDSIIGAGATVLKNITSPGTYIGTPATKLKTR